MPLTSYMAIKGKSQGDIKGGCKQGGDKADKVIVYAVRHNVDIPRDTHTGLPTGQRIHHPYTVTKSVDVASPKLYQACCSGEQCEVTLDFYRIKLEGIEEKYYTVKMEEAIVVAMEHDTPLTFLPDNKPYQDMERVSFTYSKITWTYNDGNIEFVDDWKK